MERGDYYCDGCTKVIEGSYILRDSPASRSSGAPLCPACHGPLRWVQQPPRGPYGAALAAGLRAFATRGAALWLFGMALFCQLVSYIPFGKPIAVGVMLCLGAQVFHRATDGKLELPTVVDLASPVDFVQIIGRFAVAATIPFIPYWMLDQSFGSGPVLLPVAAAFGVFYLPAAMILACLNHSGVAPLNLLAGLALIGRVPAAYGATSAVVVALGGGGYFIASMLEEAARAATAASLLSVLLRTTVVLATSMMVARVLGTFIYQHEDELGVFDYG